MQHSLILKEASIDEWQKAYIEDQDAAFSQSHTWSMIWAKYLDYTLVPVSIFIGSEKVGLIPLVNKRYYLGNYYISGINGYGGLLKTKNISYLEYMQIMQNISYKFRSFYVLCNPFETYSSYGQMISVYGKQTLNETIQYLDLRNGFETQYKSWSKGHRSAAKQGIREGVIVRKADTIEDWRSYYSVYEDSLRRWGEKASSRYSWDLFSLLYEQRSQDIVLWLAQYKEKIIAGALCFYSHKHVAYWHGAVLEDSLWLKAPHVLQYYIAKDAATRGFWWYDMLTSGGHEGVQKFKQGFAANSINLLVINKRPKIIRTLSNLKMRIRAIL